MSGQRFFRFVFAMLLSIALVLSILPASRVHGLPRSQDSPTPTPTPLPVLPDEACFTWNLALDFQLAPNQANPGPDACGQVDVWHFLESASLDRDPATYTLLPEFVQDIAAILGLEGWRGVQDPELPVVGLNATGLPQTSATWVWPPDVIYVHPAPTRMVIVGWRSPVDGVVAISGSVSDLDANGGDGVEWYIDKGAANLTSGDYWDGGAQDFENGTGGSIVANVSVSQDEFIYFIVHPRGDFDYDSTELDITVTLVQAPQPEANFYFYPEQPSSFDMIWFYDGSWDPADVGFQSQEWDFGDGTTANGCCPSHQYTADGDYAVQLTVTTWDGRSASTSRIVSVRTHDVAITKFSVPGSASAGQTRKISVGINSKRYPEQVEVTLWRSVPGGYDWVGSLRQYVPVRPANRTTDFKFSYTFTSADAQIGKVTFRAEANIVDAWDALPADNQAISAPVKVRK